MQLDITKEELGVLRFAVSLAVDVLRDWSRSKELPKLEALHKRLLEVDEVEK